MSGQVVISCSMRYINEAKHWRNVLRSAGFRVWIPNDTLSPAEWAELSFEQQRSIKHTLIEEHMREIDRADAVFILNPEGRTGASVMFELGYAIARHKPVYGLAPDAEANADLYYQPYCSRPERLIRELRALEVSH